MKISLITVSYNSERTIQETIESVLSQSQAEFDYLMIDGGSHDRTNQIIASFANYNSSICHISESDKGIYDAMNKGAQRASGEVIGFLNSDDFFADKYVIRDVSQIFKKTGADVVYGDIDIFSDDTSRQLVRSWRSGKFSRASLKFGWHPPHPAFYMRRSLFESHGGFDLGIGLSADYDLMIRALMTPSCQVAYLDRVLVKMRQGGASTSGLGPILDGWKTCQKPWRKLGRPCSGFMAATIKPLRKLVQIKL